MHACRSILLFSANSLLLISVIECGSNMLCIFRPVINVIPFPLDFALVKVPCVLVGEEKKAFHVDVPHINVKEYFIQKHLRKIFA